MLINKSAMTRCEHLFGNYNTWLSYALLFQDLAAYHVPHTDFLYNYLIYIIVYIMPTPDAKLMHIIESLNIAHS